MAIFGKDEPTQRRAARAPGTESMLTIIAAGTTIAGDIDCAGVLKVEGTIEGSVHRARQVLLAREGAIHGSVTAQEVVVGGVIDGNVQAGDRLELQSSAVVNGDIATKSIVVMEGARINGSVKMTEIALVGGSQPGRESLRASAGGS
jgi:cytoskeletal protein CcmA (bactofilin family)